MVSASETSAGASQQPGRSDFNIQHSETHSSRSQEEALHPACLKEAVGGWVIGWWRGWRWRHRVLRGPPPFITSLQHFQHGGIVKRERAGRPLVVSVGFQRRAAVVRGHGEGFLSSPLHVILVPLLQRHNLSESTGSVYLLREFPRPPALTLCVCALPRP